MKQTVKSHDKQVYQEPEDADRRRRPRDHPLGRHPGEAVVIEDRGRLGAEGERILRVHLKLGDDIDQEFEIPETDVIELVSS